MKQKNKIAMFLSIACLVVGGVIATTISDDNVLFSHAEKEYSITCDTKTNAIPGLTLTEEEINNTPNGDYYGQALKYNVVTSDGTKDIQFFVKGAFVNPNGLVGLTINGGIGNYYDVYHEYHGRINGLKSITVNFTGGPLTASYSYEPLMEKGQYRVTSQPIKSGVPYTFDNNFPQYFSINTELLGHVMVKDLKVVYSCSQDQQNIPSGEFYDAGYQIGNTHGEETFKKTVTSNADCAFALQEAAARHYQVAEITCDYEGIDDAYTMVGLRRDFSHVDIQPMTYTQTKGSINTFAILYEGDTSFNNDYVYGESTDPLARGVAEHFSVASYYTNTNLDNLAKPLVNAASAIRLKAAKDNNLMRPENYDDFAPDKLDNSKAFDVYNSEDLWWALQHGFKPNFPLTNSKAEWIYKEAKKILNSIIYNGMSDYEKARAIYEWIIENTQYDYDALHTSRNIPENVCFFLEGVFERRMGVCDSFSKTFILLGKLEGLDVIRGVGFGNGGGHAWGYFRSSPTEDYYLICPTWGDNVYKLENLGISSYLSYDSFMNPKTYFGDKSGNEVSFTDYNNENMPLATTPYPQNVYDLDNLPSNEAYDYVIDTSDEFFAVLQDSLNACNGKNFCLEIAYTIKDFQAQASELIKQSCFKDTTYRFDGYIDQTAYGVDLIQLVFYL